MHELYMWPFQDALKAGAGNIMSVESKKRKTRDNLANPCPGVLTTE
jgi:hypothetical protein